MKRLLLGPVLALPLFLGLCHFTTPKLPQLPKVPEVVREIPLDDFNAFPPVPSMPSVAPAVPARKPHVTKPHQVKPRAARPTQRVDRKPVPPRVEELPPQQGPICIFPLNMIPNCTPQEVQ